MKIRSRRKHDYELLEIIENIIPIRDYIAKSNS